MVMFIRFSIGWLGNEKSQDQRGSLADLDVLVMGEAQGKDGV
jgi:hypothetical protein